MGERALERGEVAKLGRNEKSSTSKEQGAGGEASGALINDSSPPASRHAEFVHMSVKRREAFVNKHSVGVCVSASLGSGGG